MTVENDSVEPPPAEERDTSRELVDYDHIVGFELSSDRPIGGRDVGDVDREDESLEDVSRREVEEECREKELRNKVELTQDSAYDRESPEERTRKDRVAKDVDLERTCKIIDETNNQLVGCVDVIRADYSRRLPCEYSLFAL